MSSTPAPFGPDASRVDPPHPAPANEVSSRAYVAPAITPLGTLAELTLGGIDGPDDGFGGAGETGSI